jgi:maltose O-acetyltransferase
MLNGKITIKQSVCLFLYYTIARYLPDSYSKVFGKTSNAIRVFLCKRIFKRAGAIKTINKKVSFGSGRNIEMGDNSGIGARTHIPSNTIIGDNVIFGRDCYVLARNHEFSDINTPIVKQGFRPNVQTIIEDDCWIGLRCLFTPGRHIKKGTIIGMGSVVTKDFPEYSIIGGAPAKFIKSRIGTN